MKYRCWVKTDKQTWIDLGVVEARTPHGCFLKVLLEKSTLQDVVDDETKAIGWDYAQFHYTSLNKLKQFVKDQMYYEENVDESFVPIRSPHYVLTNDMDECCRAYIFAFPLDKYREWLDNEVVLVPKGRTSRSRQK